MRAPVLIAWGELVEFVNDRTFLGEIGVRDPDHVCEDFDRLGYDGRGTCRSDGHYLCVECSKLASDAPRFEEYGRDGRRDRLRLFFASRRRATQDQSKVGGG